MSLTGFLLYLFLSGAASSLIGPPDNNEDKTAATDPAQQEQATIIEQEETEIPPSDENPLPPTKEDLLAENIIKNWQQGETPPECSYLVSRKQTEPLIAISCHGSYTGKLRNLLLDYFFSQNQKLASEKYLHSENSAVYTYFFQDNSGADRKTWIKLFFHGDKANWPVEKSHPPEVILVIEHPVGVDEIIRWQTLGVPVSFGIDPDHPMFDQQKTKIRQYNQSMIYCPVIKNGINNFPPVSMIGPGMYEGYCLNQPDLSRKSIEWARSFFTQVSSLTTPYLLIDTTPGELTVPTETARIMEIGIYRLNAVFGNDPQQNAREWKKLLYALQKNRKAVLFITSSDNNIIDQVRVLIQKSRKVIHFVSPSTFATSTKPAKEE